MHFLVVVKCTEVVANVGKERNCRQDLKITYIHKKVKRRHKPKQWLKQQK